jgi:hypothetical protein
MKIADKVKEDRSIVDEDSGDGSSQNRANAKHD